MSTIEKYGLLEALKGRDDVDSIEGQIYLSALTKQNHVEYSHPIKTNLTISCICLQGELIGKIDMIEHRIQAGGLAITRPGQILETVGYSDDFRGILIYMTPAFTQNFNLLLGHSVSLSLEKNPYIRLKEKELRSMLNYCDMVKSAIRAEDNPHRLKIIIHLTIAYFYGVGYYIHKFTEEKHLTKNEGIAEKFLNKVREHYKTERSVEYYAQQMQLTANYLSHVVKEVTKKTASQWIDEYVTLEAKALIKSTDMTIQEIADELNFPSQSFFGKYFKRMVGVAPKLYK